MINTDMELLFEYLKESKNCYDYRDADTSDIFSVFNECPEEYEWTARDEIYSLDECIKITELYYEGANEDEDDPAGEEITLFCDDMAKYFRLLKRLKEKKVISNAEYKARKTEMERQIYFTLTANDYNYGLCVYFGYSRKKKQGQCVIIDVCFEQFYQYFSLYCNILLAFDYCSKKLYQLEMEYGYKLQLQEAA